MRAALRVPLPVEGVRLSLWRAVVIFRVGSLAICLVLIVHWQDIYARPAVALATGAGMIVVTAAVGVLGVSGRAHRPAVLAADVVLTAGLTLLSIPAQTPGQQHGSMVTITTIWAGGPTIEAAFLLGPVGGAIAAVLQYGITTVIAEQGDGRTLYSGVLLLVTGVAVGFVSRLVIRAENELRVAAAAQAAVAERERLARSIHDGVLQVLGLVHRTGRDAGGQWARIAEAAGEQEVALRGLITSRPVEDDDLGHRNLADELRALTSAQVTVSTPSESVPVAVRTAAEMSDAVRAALHNVEQHAGDGAHAWVLLEAVDDEVRVTVRDDGAGIPPGRLDDAEREGRIGVARSVRGRLTDLGGRCTITSAPGEGTEIEMVVPLT